MIDILLCDPSLFPLLHNISNFFVLIFHSDSSLQTLFLLCIKSVLFIFSNKIFPFSFNLSEDKQYFIIFYKRKFKNNLSDENLDLLDF